MGDEDDGLPQFRLELQELGLHVAADQRVEGAERLVHEDDVGVGGQRPCQADALLHPTGKLVGQVVLPVAQSDQVEGVRGAFVALGTRHPADFQPVGGVLQHSAVREERKVLEDHADLFAAQGAQGAPGQGGDVGSVDLHCPRSRRQQPVEHADQRGLPGPGKPHDHEDLTWLDFEGDVDDRGCDVQVLDRVAVAPVRQQCDGLGCSFAEHLVQVVRAYSWHGFPSVDFVWHGVFCVVPSSALVTCH